MAAFGTGFVVRDSPIHHSIRNDFDFDLAPQLTVLHEYRHQHLYSIRLSKY